MNHSSRQVSS